MSAGGVREIILAELGLGLPALTPEFGAAMAQAAAICFEVEGHSSGVVMSLQGVVGERCNVFWTGLLLTSEAVVSEIAEKGGALEIPGRESDY